MAGIEIPCPKCGMMLKLPDRRLLGRKGKCGQCGHKFILEEPPPPEEPSEINFELANAATQAPADQTIMGMDARWVTVPNAAPATAPVRTPPVSPFPQFAAPQPAPSPQPQIAPEPSFTLPEVRMGGVEEETGGRARLRSLKRKKSKGRNLVLLASAAVVVVAAGVYFFALSGSGPAKKPSKGKSNKPEAVASNSHGPSESATGAVRGGTAVSPTKGKPIDLLLVPTGAWMVINLRPAELWKTGDDAAAAEEFRACLGPLGTWAGEMLKTHCLMEPTRIEEAMICLFPEEKLGMPPDVAFVIHTTEDVKKSELIEKFQGELVDDPRPHYVGPDKAYLIRDPRTFAIAPAKWADELVQSADNSSIAAPGIQELLNKTDRNRHISIVFEPGSARKVIPFLGPENAHPLLHSLLDWVGEEVEGVVWSMHLGEKFHSEVLFRNQVGSPQRLQRTLVKQMETTPRDILAIVQKMNPQEIGKRKIIGRFPAMSKVYALSTQVSTGDRLVAMTTSLPERAAPNLALGALLAWDQTTRPDYGKTGTKQPAGGSQQPKLPDLIADRLKMKISVDYRAEPLWQAIEFVSTELSVPYKIEGNDLKMVGVTQNEKQEFKMDNVPASVVLYEILERKSGKARTDNRLVLILDEKKKLMTITSAKVAEEKKLDTFPLAPAK